MSLQIDVMVAIRNPANPDDPSDIIGIRQTVSVAFVPTSDDENEAARDAITQAGAALLELIDETRGKAHDQVAELNRELGA